MMHIHEFTGKNGTCRIKGCGLMREQIEDPNRVMIGTTLYRYMNENENRMGRDQKMLPLWQEMNVTGESPTHWHLSYANWPARKVRKATLYEAGKVGYTGCQWYTSNQKADREWQGRHRSKIGDRIRHDGKITADQMRQIAKIIGYEEN